MELGGLAERDALELAAAVLSDYGLDRGAFSRKALVELMELLGGHPLSLYLALPQLRYYRPAELAARFEELLPGFSTGAAKERNESLLVSLEFSLRRLGEATRAALPALAVFEGGAMEYDLLAITQFDKEMWQQARAELEQAALVSVESVPGVNAPFLRFHPTLLPYLATKLSGEQRKILEERYREEYYKTANSLYQMDTQHPHEARAIAQREMPNLKRAFELMAAAATSDRQHPAGTENRQDAGDPRAAEFAVDFAASLARFLNVFGRWRERDALLAQVAGLQLGGAEGVTKAEFMRLSQQIDVLRQQGRAQQAEQVCRDLLAKIEAGAAYDVAYHHALTLRNLGLCLSAQGRQTLAIECQRRALQEFEPISASDENAKKMAGYVSADLGDNLRAIGRFDEAQQAYDRALAIARETEDHRATGVALGQLGGLAMLRKDLRTAAQRYIEALQTFRALDEPQSEAVIWHQLGIVAEKARDWEEAERCYRESLRLDEQMHDMQGAAQTCNQLAIVAKGAGRLTDAERWYLRAVEIDEKLGNPKELATDYNNLANLYLQQQRLDEAETYARRAVAIMEQLDLSAQPWATYNILSEIAAARGRAAEAASCRRKEQESFAAYAGSSQTVQQWKEKIAVIVAACQGNAEAQEAAQQIVAQFQAHKNWAALAAAFQRILDGERDLEQLRESLDFDHFVIVRALLAQLTGDDSELEQGTNEPDGDEEGLSFDEFFALVAQAMQPGAPPELKTQMLGVTEQLAANADLPDELRRLGAVLGQLLSGVTPDFAALPPQLAEMLRGKLQG